MRRLSAILLLSGLVGILASAAGATPFSLQSSVNFTGTGFDVTFNPIGLAQYNALDRTFAGDAVCLETNPNGGCDPAALDTLDVFYFSVTVNSGAVSQLLALTYTFGGTPFANFNAVLAAGYIAGSDPNPGHADIPSPNYASALFRTSAASDTNWISATDTSDVLWVAYNNGAGLSAGDSVNYMVKASGFGAVNDFTGIVAEIPEPGTALLLSGGLLGLVIGSRRRSR